MELQNASQTKSLLAILAAGVSAWFAWRKWKSLEHLPPGKLFMWPLLGESVRYIADPLKFVEEKLTEHGGTFRSNVLLGNTVFLAVTDSNAKLFYSRKDLGWPLHFQKLVGLKALPMVNDPLHKKLRTLNGRAFGDRQLDSYLSKLSKLSSKYLDLWVDNADSKDLHMEVKKYAFECGEAVILGVENDQLKTDRFMQLYDKAFRGLGYVLPFDLPGFPFRQCMNARRQLVEDFKDVIQQKRKKLQDPCRMFKINTMLDTMLQTEDNSSDEELLDFCVGMMFAAHDTTLCSIQSCLHWLKCVPTVEERLRREAHSVWDGEEPITRKILESLPQLKAFLQEVWRMTPPVVVISRRVTEDIEVDGYIVPKGWKLNFAPAGKHSKCEEPETFSIERHLDQGKFLDRLFDPTYFNSFGGGSRMCIGYKFARDEMLVFFLHFLRGYDLKLDQSDRQKFPFNFWRLKGAFQRCGIDGKPT